MVKKTSINMEIKSQIKLCILLILVMLLSILPMEVYTRWQLSSSYQLLKSMLLIYCSAGIGCIFLFASLKISKMIWRWLDHDAIQNRLRICSYRLCEWYRSRNSKTIYPRLQNFIFYVMSKNKEQLPLPVGNDVSCLTPYGMMYTYRHNCVFYRFQLVIPDVLDLPLSHVKRLLQHYITTESRNYGIVGLYNSYEDLRHNIWDSIYVDQMVLDEENHILSFDVLYVSSEKASKYMLLAIQREQSSSNNTQEIYDDAI